MGTLLGVHSIVNLIPPLSGSILILGRGFFLPSNPPPKKKGSLPWTHSKNPLKISLPTRNAVFLCVFPKQHHFSKGGAPFPQVAASYSNSTATHVCFTQLSSKLRSKLPARLIICLKKIMEIHLRMGPFHPTTRWGASPRDPVLRRVK